MTSLQPPQLPGWQATAPPLSPASRPDNRGSFPGPPPPRPTVHDVDDDDTTDFEESCSGGESNGGSETGVTAKKTPHTGKPGEGKPGFADGEVPRERPDVQGAPRFPERTTSVNVLAEIRKMIKEERMWYPLSTRAVYSTDIVLHSSENAEQNGIRTDRPPRPGPADPWNTNTKLIGEPLSAADTEHSHNPRFSSAPGRSAPENAGTVSQGAARCPVG